jgi:hypothetical protein
MTHTWGSGPWPETGEGNGQVWLHGLGIGLAAGFGIYVTETLVIGPFFRMVFGVWPTGCWHHQNDAPGATGDEGCDSVDDLYGDADLPHLWSLGIALGHYF